MSKLTRIVINVLIAIRNLVVHEAPLLAGVLLAAAAPLFQTPALIPAAVGVAALRFVVSPAFQQAAYRAKIVPPSFADQVVAVLEAHGVTIDPAIATPPGPEAVSTS